MSIFIQPQNIQNNPDYSQLLLSGQKSLAIQNLKSAYAMVRTTPSRQAEGDRSKSILILDKDQRLSGLAESLSGNPLYSAWTASGDKGAAEIAGSIHIHLVVTDWMSAQALGEEWAAAMKAQAPVGGLPIVLLVGPRPEGGKLNAFENCLTDWAVDSDDVNPRIDFLLAVCEQLGQLRRTNLELVGEVEQKQRELFLHLELLMHAGGVKDKMLESVNKLIPYLNMEGRSKLNTMVKQLRWELNDEANINFVRAFDDLNSKFYTNLEQTCSLITRGEKRLCAFLVKGHSSSEIARITRKSQNSINVAFSRLRAKLGLSNSKDLRSFLERLFLKSGNKPSLSAAQFLIS